MRIDIREMMENQAAWQRSRAERPWAQKLRESAAMRHAVTSLKKYPSPTCKAISKQKPIQQPATETKR